MEYFKTKISLTERELYELAQSLELVYLDSGEYIMRQGEIGDNCYIILDGEVSIQIENIMMKEIVLKEAPTIRFSERKLISVYSAEEKTFSRSNTSKNFTQVTQQTPSESNQ